MERLVREVAEKRGAKSAHYMHMTLTSVFKSLPKNLGVGNPARDAGTVIELPRNTTLKGWPLAAKQIPPFLDAVDRYPGRIATKLAIKLLMLTFVRKRELSSATWDEVDLERGEWVIPAERMKMRKPQIVPLSSQAVECFKNLKPLSFGSRYVFPNLGDPTLVGWTIVSGSVGFVPNPGSWTAFEGTRTQRGVN